MATIEKLAKDLVVGDTIIAKQGGYKFVIVSIMVGISGPYLTLRREDGSEAEHDTSFDSRSATYTVEVPDVQ